MSDFVSVLGSTYNNSVWFYSPWKTRLDPFQESLFVQVEHLPFEDVAVDEYLNANMPILRENTTNFSIAESMPSSLSGTAAQKLVYTYASEGVDYKDILIASIKDNNVYYITFYSVPSDYSTYLPIVEKMLESFSIEIINK
jgi:eukaryotic-like serine/threonine-protein kinase